MYAIDTALEMYRNTTNVAIAFIQNKDVKEVCNQIVDTQIELTKTIANSVQTYFSTLAKTATAAKK